MRGRELNVTHSMTIHNQFHKHFIVDIDFSMN